MYSWIMESKHIISALSALAHEGRLDLFRRLVEAGMDGLPAGVLAEEASVNFTTASAQLKELSNAGLITSRRKGRSVIYSPDFGTMQAIISYLLENCCQGACDTPHTSTHTKETS